MRGLPADVVERIVAAALAEDLGAPGDITTDCVVAESVRARGRIVARQDLVLAGLPVARQVFRALAPELAFEALEEEGARAARGTALARLEGAARPILRGERTALNFLGRMSGIATAARAAVEEIAGTGARILDTRKTAPGLRVLDKYAVAVGGASNHRMGLFDAVLIKDTHLGTGLTVGAAVRRALEAGHPRESVTIEVRDVAELAQAIDAGAGRALLDNMNATQVAEAVRFAAGRIELEVSGGLRPGSLRQLAATGVDYLSLGWLTHSAPAADVALDVEVAA
jgi:nicotinate-nucleotide pyrophosphorylase (carboxylating)